MSSKQKTVHTPVKSRFTSVGLVIGLILVVGLLLRTVRLGFTLLWIDELNVFWNSSLPRGLSDILRDTIFNVFQSSTGEHMPFQYLWLNSFLRLYQALGWPPGSALVRLPFALLGFLSLCVLYPAARRWYGRDTAVWTLLLTALSFFHVYQSRDATSYGPLMFFMALQLYGLAGWVRSEVVRKRDRFAFVAGTFGMLATHLSAWFFLGVEGLLLLGRAIVIRLRAQDKVSWRAEVIGGRFEPAAWLVLCALPFLIVVYRALTVFQPSGLKEDVEVTTLSFTFLRYQLAHFGWGLSGGRLLGFGLVLLSGAVALLRDRASRGRGAAHLALLLVPAVLLFLAPHAQVFPRYMTVCFVPLMGVAGRGAAWSVEQARRLLRLPERLQWAPVVFLVLFVVGWQVRPLGEIFKLRTKLMPIPQLITWLETTLPENGLYVWQSGFNLRDVPGGYPVRGRHAAFATMHSGSIKASPAAEQWGPFARSIFQRFPLAAFLATDFPDPPASGPWAWIGTDFARREVIRNESLESLHRYGFCHSGSVYPSNINIVCYYNKPEDLPARQGSDGRPFLAYPEGPGWQYPQSRDGALFASPNPSAVLRVRHLSRDAQAARVVLEGVVQATGSLRVTGPDGKLLNKTLQPANHLKEELGPFLFPPGDQDVRIEFWPAREAALLLYSFQVVPVAEGAVPAEESR